MRKKNQGEGVALRERFFAFSRGQLAGAGRGDHCLVHGAWGGKKIAPRWQGRERNRQRDGGKNGQSQVTGEEKNRLDV